MEDPPKIKMISFVLSFVFVYGMGRVAALYFSEPWWMQLVITIIAAVGYAFILYSINEIEDLVVK